MAQETDAQEIAGRIEALLEDIGQQSQPAVQAAAEELVRSLMRFYGAGIEQLLTVVRAAAGDQMVHRLAADPLVSSLLALHDLHPVDVHIRVGHAMDQARRKVGQQAGEIERGSFGTDGIVRVRLTSSGCGANTVKAAIEAAIAELAPEVAGVEYENVKAGQPLLQIQTRPPVRAAP